MKPQQPRRQANATQKARNTAILKTSRDSVKYTHPLLELHTAKNKQTNTHTLIQTQIKVKWHEIGRALPLTVCLQNAIFLPLLLVAAGIKEVIADQEASKGQYHSQQQRACRRSICFGSGHGVLGLCCLYFGVMVGRHILRHGHLIGRYMYM